MAPGHWKLHWFAEETAAVERAVDALTKRLEKLEANDAWWKFGASILLFAFLSYTGSTGLSPKCVSRRRFAYLAADALPDA